MRLSNLQCCQPGLSKFSIICPAPVNNSISGNPLPHIYSGPLTLLVVLRPSTLCHFELLHRCWCVGAVSSTWKTTFPPAPTRPSPPSEHSSASPDVGVSLALSFLWTPIYSPSLTPSPLKSSWDLVICYLLLSGNYFRHILYVSLTPCRYGAENRENINYLSTSTRVWYIASFSLYTC